MAIVDRKLTFLRLEVKPVYKTTLAKLLSARSFSLVLPLSLV